MKLRTAHIARMKNIPMKDIASRLGITPESLSASLNGNPKLSRLEEVAEILEVPVSALFEPQPLKPVLQGYVGLYGRIYTIRCLKDLRDLVKEAEEFYITNDLPENV